MLISIILPCRNEEAYIGPCLESVLATEYPVEDVEVLVVDGRSDDRTREIVSGYAARHSSVRLLDNPERVVPAALNAGIRVATGDVIIRMDAHVVYPPDYVPQLVRALLESGADNVGGRLITLPAAQDPVARAIAVALSHPFGVGNSHFRIGSSQRKWVDTVAFGCFRRDVFARFGLFDEELVRNQDDEFNHRLIRRGGRILLVPEAVSFYYARRSLRQLARMYYQYGHFKPLAASKVGRIMTVRQLIPAAFVVAVVASSLLAPFWPPAALAFWGIAASYTIAAAVAAAPTAASKGPRCGVALIAAFLVVHVSYGIGFLRGAVALLFGRGERRQHAPGVPLSR